MLYAPHILFVLRKSETRDEYNRVSFVGEKWERVGLCRCDDNSTSLISALDSKEYVPRYHVVTARTNAIKAGDTVRILTKDGEKRGEGKADNVKVLNYLDYTDFYVGN